MFHYRMSSIRISDFMFKSKIFHKLFKSDFYLSLDDLNHVASNVNLRFNDEQIKFCKTRMDSLLDLIDILAKVDEKKNENDGELNMINYIHKRMGLNMYQREDEVKKEESADIFSNTEEEINFFVSPKVLDNN